VRGLNKHFTSSKGTTVALNNINFVTPRREFLCVVGPSGCGKSTLVRILAGLEEKTSGDVLFAGQPSVRARQRPRHGVQGYTLFPC